MKRFKSDAASRKADMIRLCLESEIKKQEEEKHNANKPERAPSAFFVFKEDFRKPYKIENPNNKSVAAKMNQGKVPSLSEARKQYEQENPRPSPPPCAFFLFMQDFGKQYKEKHPNISSVDFRRASRAAWKSMSHEEKAPFVAEAGKRNEEYERELGAYVRKRMEYEREYELELEAHKRKWDAADKKDEEESGEVIGYVTTTSAGSSASVVSFVDYETLRRQVKDEVLQEVRAEMQACMEAATQAQMAKLMQTLSQQGIVAPKAPSVPSSADT